MVLQRYYNFCCSLLHFQAPVFVRQQQNVADNRPSCLTCISVVSPSDNFKKNNKKISRHPLCVPRFPDCPLPLRSLPAIPCLSAPFKALPTQSAVCVLNASKTGLKTAHSAMIQIVYCGSSAILSCLNLIKQRNGAAIIALAIYII